MLSNVIKFPDKRKARAKANQRKEKEQHFEVLSKMIADATSLHDAIFLVEYYCISNNIPSSQYDVVWLLDHAELTQVK
jgi:hypothetical protein